MTVGIKTDGSKGYIDLTTTTNYINNQKLGKFGFVCVVRLFDDVAQDARVMSYELADAASHQIIYDLANQKFEGEIFATENFNAVAAHTARKTVKVIMAFDGTSIGYITTAGSKKTFTPGQDSYTTIEVGQTDFVRLGARAYSLVNNSEMVFGGFFIMNLTSETIDATWIQGLADELDAVDNDPDNIRTAILDHGSSIDGVYWPLNEIGIDEEVDDTLLLAYNLNANTVNTSYGALVSEEGVTSAYLEITKDGKYATVGEADNYFDQVLNSDAWSDAVEADKEKALIMATRVIDQLNYEGEIAADGQELQFPRDDDTSIPQNVRDACCEEAFALIDNRDIELERDNLRVSSQGYSSVKTSYKETMATPNLVAGILSTKAWDLLLPYLRDVSTIKVNRS